MDGVHGYVDHVVRHVVMEQSNVVEHVIAPVEKMVVMAQVLMKEHVP